MVIFINNIKPFSLPDEECWIIVLDACRYDFFVKVWGNEGVEPRYSLDSYTVDVLKALPVMKDTVVVTGHLFLLLFRDKFGEVIDVGFGYDFDTVHPRRIVSNVLRYVPFVVFNK